jgi:alcohol dehydrogenase (NADP+)
MRDMLQFAADKQIKPWIVKYPMDKVNEAVPAMVANKARYRIVLVNEEHGGKL